MKKLFLSLLACSYSFVLIAQDCPRYIELMSSAKRLWQDGKFEKAFDQLSSAREYCPGKTEEIDAQFKLFITEIRSKYKQVDQSRRVADSLLQQSIIREKNIANSLELLKQALLDNKKMQDSVENIALDRQRSNDKVLFLTEITDLEDLGDMAIHNRSFEESKRYFEEAINKLKSTKNRDSIFTNKQLLLEKKINSSVLALEKKAQFKTLIEKVDSCLEAGVDKYSNAYSNCFQALRIGYWNDTAEVCQKLIIIEKKLEENISYVDKLQLESYFELMALSAEANNLLDNKEIESKRIKSIVKFRPLDYSFFKSANTQVKAIKENDKFWHKLSLSSSIGLMFGRQSVTRLPAFKISDANGNKLFSYNHNSNTFNLIYLGLSYQFSSRFSTCLNMSFLNQNHTYLEQLEYNLVTGITTKSIESYDYQFDPGNISLWGEFTVLKSVILKKYPYSIQLKSGIEAFTWFEDVDDFRFLITNNKSLDNSILSDSDIEKINKYSSTVFDIHTSGSSFETQANQNTELGFCLGFGLKYTINPLRKIPNIGLFFDLTRRYSIESNSYRRRVVSYNIADNVINKLNLSYFSQADLDIIDFFEKNWDYNLEIDKSFRQFYSGWSGQVGMSFRF